MKPFVTLAATALLTWTASVAFAAPPANANFSAERGQAFSLVLDGRLLTQPLARQVHVGPLLPGRHWADFTLPSPYGRSLHFRTVVWLQPGVETSYVLMLRPGYGPQLQQVGAVALYGPGRVGSGYPAGAYPPPNTPYGGTYPVQPAPPYGSQRFPADGRYQAPMPPNGAYNDGQPGGYNSPTTPAPTPPYPGTYTPRGATPGGYYPNGAPAPGNGNYDPNAAPNPNNGSYNDPNSPDGSYLEPLAPADVQELTQDLRNQPSEEARLNLAKEALAENSVQAEDLAQLMGTLKLSKSRTELAKYGYSHVSDPENFSRVYDALRSPASIQEVQQALGLPQD